MWASLAFAALFYMLAPEEWKVLAGFVGYPLSHISTQVSALAERLHDFQYDAEKYLGIADRRRHELDLDD